MKISILVDETGSSSVASITFYAQEDDAEKLLDYPFIIKGEVYAEFVNGEEYRYSQVPLTKFIDVIMSESIGSRFNKLIVKGNYEYEKF